MGELLHLEADAPGAALMVLKFVSIALTGVFGIIGLMTSLKWMGASVFGGAWPS